MLINLGLVVFGVLLNAAAQIALKEAVAGAGAIELRTFLAVVPNLLCKPSVLIGLALYAASVVNWLVVLSRVDLSLAYALTSLIFPILFVVGVWRYHEPVSLTRIAGLVVIIFGVILITRPVSTVHV